VEFGAFPKLTANAVRRHSVENWFAFHRDTPLRYVHGPVGAGKTTTALLHARRARHEVAFAHVPPRCTMPSLLRVLDRALDVAISRVEDVAGAFPKEERFELILADIDNADEDTRQLLTRLPYDVPANVTLTYLARARNVVDTVALTTKGLCAAMDRNLLAFSQAEAAEMCDALGVSYAPTDINQLIYASEGWAFAVSGSIREAAADGRDLRGALSRWQDRNRRLIEELLSRSLAGLTPVEAEAAQRIYAGENPGAAPVYDRLHDLGLLLSFSDAELRPLRAVLPSSLKRDSYAEMVAPSIDVPMATMEMFGKFEMVIDGRRVEWFRRRDRQIVEYLSLQLDTSATRHNLLTTFWRDADPQLAGQSLRTACSTIRRAIAQCVGYDRVHCYFTAGRSLRINTDHVSISSLRFRSHMREAEAATNDGNEAEARAHYLAASRIYRGPLLDSNGIEPWFRAERESFASAAAFAAERALEMRSKRRFNAGLEPTSVQLSFST
jgi:hypothetical protein